VTPAKIGKFSGKEVPGTTTFQCAGTFDQKKFDEKNKDEPSLIAQTILDGLSSLGSTFANLTV
jgi:hypothetical protein